MNNTHVHVNMGCMWVVLAVFIVIFADESHCQKCVGNMSNECFLTVSLHGQLYEQTFSFLPLCIYMYVYIYMYMCADKGTYMYTLSGGRGTHTDYLLCVCLLCTLGLRKYNIVI